MSRREDLAWAAGFLVGEGWATLTGRAGRRTSPVLACEQAEREPLEQLQRIFGGTILSPRHRSENRKPIHKWELAGHTNVQNAIAQMWSWLSPRRREQWGAVVKASSGFLRGWQQCLHAGHPVAPNTRGFMVCALRHGYAAAGARAVGVDE